MNDGLEPETVGVILENRKLTAELAALRQQLAEARAEVERLVEERERTINELHDAADELSCPHVHGIETVDGKAEAVWLGAMVAKQLRVNAERNGVERGEVAKLLEDNWRLYKQQLAAQAAELERLKRELDGAVNHHSHNMNRIDRALGEPRYKDCYLVQAFERRIAEKDAELERLRKDQQDAGTMVRRLLYQLNKVSPGLKLCEQANDWLKRKGLQGSILRENE